MAPWWVMSIPWAVGDVGRVLREPGTHGFSQGLRVSCCGAWAHNTPWVLHNWSISLALQPLPPYLSGSFPSGKRLCWQTCQSMNPKEPTLCPSRRCAAGRWEAGGAFTVEEATKGVSPAPSPSPGSGLCTSSARSFCAIQWSRSLQPAVLLPRIGIFLCALLVSSGEGLCPPGDT